MKRFFRNIILFFNFCAIAVLLVTYLSVIVSPATFWAPALIGLAYPYIFFVNVLFILYWLFSSPKWSLLSLAVILLGYTHVINYFQFLPKETDDEGISICSYNVKGFHENGYENRMDNAHGIVDFLSAQKPDIVCIQEMAYFRGGYKGFEQKFDLKALPKYVDARKNMHLITYTNFPIVGKGEFIFEGTSNMIIYTDVLTSTDTLRIFNCHLESYRFTADDISSLDSLSISKKDHNMKEFRLFGSKLKKAFIKRAEQSEMLRQQIDKSPYPVIICGDFNDTPVSYTYRTVLGDLKDAFVESGVGIGNTYIGRLPSFRIDYIMHSPQFTGYNFEVGQVEYSDHYPVSCKLIKN